MVQRHAIIAEIEAGGAILPRKAIGGNQFVDNLVVGLVFAERLLDPVGVRLPAIRAGAIAGLDAEQVGPPGEVVVDVALGIQQLIDELGALVGVMIIAKREGFGSRRDAADDVEVDAAEKDIIVGGGVGLDLVFFVAGLEVLVDVPCGGLNFGERWGLALSLASLDIGLSEALDERNFAGEVTGHRWEIEETDGCENSGGPADEGRHVQLHVYLYPQTTPELQSSHWMTRHHNCGESASKADQKSGEEEITGADWTCERALGLL